MRDYKYLVLLTFAGQQLKRIEVIEDDESEIVEAVRRMSDKYDFVVTRLVDAGMIVLSLR